MGVNLRRIFDTGSWQVAVMYKGATTGATSYNAFVRRDLLNPAVLSCASGHCG